MRDTKRRSKGDDKGSESLTHETASKQKIKKSRRSSLFRLPPYIVYLSYAATSCFLSFSILGRLLDGFCQPINFIHTKQTGTLCLTSFCHRSS